MKDPSNSVVNRDLRMHKPLLQRISENPARVESKRHLQRNRPRKLLQQTPMDDKQQNYTPWLVLAPEREYVNVETRLHDEIVAYITYIQPTPQERASRQKLYYRIQELCLAFSPRCQVNLFGSCATGLELPTSDIDIVVVMPWVKASNVKKTLFQLAAHFKSWYLTPETFVNAHARIPIINFKTSDEYGSFNVDLGINNTDGLEGIKYICGYLQNLPALFPLVLVVKGFLSQRSLNDPSKGGLGSYATLCMCISFLQINPRKRPHALIDKPMETQSLGQLLIDFFEYYGLNFAYKTSCISIAEGTLLPKVSASWIRPEDRDKERISIQCPVNPEIDVAKSVNNIEPLQNEFRKAYSHLMQLTLVDKNMLGSIVSLSQQVILDRARVAQLVDSNRTMESPHPFAPHRRPPSRGSRSQYVRNLPHRT